MNKILTLITLTLSYIYALPQCNVSILTPFPDTLEVPCGSFPILERDTLGQYAIYNDFNNGSVGLGWLTTSNATLTNPCGIKSTNYLWFGNGSTAPRNLQTLPMDLTCGGDICFELKFAIQSAASPCEGPDLVTEGVTLEWRTAPFGAWTTINYFQPNTTGNINAAYLNAGDYTTWATYCFPIPIAAMGPMTEIRWMQYNSTTAQFDHWGLDLITISTNCGQVDNLWSTGDTSRFTNVTQSFGDSLYWVRRIIGIDTCYDSIVVSSQNPYVNVYPTETTYCTDEQSIVKINPNSSLFLDPTVTYNWSWSPSVLFDSMSQNYGSIPSLTNDTMIYYDITHPLYPQCSFTDSTFLNLGGVKFDSMNYSNPICFRDVNGGSVYFDWYNPISNPFTRLYKNGIHQGVTYGNLYTNLVSDTYTLVIRDNRCLDTLGFRIELPDSVLLDTSQIIIDICQISPTTQTVIPYNGISPYTIYWDNVLGNPINLQSNTDTTISVYAKDSVGCATDIFTFTFMLPNPILVDPITIITCPYEVVQLNTNVNGGLGVYTYNWSNGSTDSNITATNTPWYIYTVTVSDGCMYPYVMSPFLSQFPLPSGLMVTPKMCEGNSIFFDSPSGMSQYTISLENKIYTTNSGDMVSKNPGIKNAYLVLITPDGCILKDTVTYEVVDRPFASFEYDDHVDHILLQNDLVLFDNTSSNYTTSLWTVENKDYNTNDLNYQFENSGDYNIILVVSNDFGCKDTVNQDISVFPNFEMYIPNAFTPNGDGTNEFFNLNGNNGFIKEGTFFDFSITIYNRWGGEVYESNDPNFKWGGLHNGMRVPNGVYFYVVKASFPKSKRLNFKGNVTILD